MNRSTRSAHPLLLLLLSLVAGLAAGAVPGWCVTESESSRPGAGGAPTPVRVGLYLADLGEIGGADQTFLADVVLQASWDDPRLAGRWDRPTSVELDAVWNPRLSVVNQRGISPMLPQRVEVDPSGRVHYRQRYAGRFTARLDLRDFPMDRQRLGIQVVSLGYPRGEVDLAGFPDARRAGRNDELSITDWDVGPVALEAADFEPTPGSGSLAGFRLAWDVRRYTRYYVLSVILPLMLIVMMGWSALWIDPTVLVTRMSTSITTMLTLIAYRFALAQMVPKLTYLTRFDYFTLGSTILVFLMLMTVTATAWLMRRDRRGLVDRIDIGARIAFPVLFAGICLLFWRG